MTNRRNFLQSALAVGAGLTAAPRLLAIDHRSSPIPVNTPDIPNLPFTLDNGVKVFRLTAEPVKQQILPGKILDLWGYNGSAPGPTLQAVEGDRVRILFENHLPEATAVHWHGLEISEAMDGVPGIGQLPINPGGKFTYEFTLHQNGTFFYHSHMAMQEMIGMIGAFILHPRDAYTPHAAADHVIILQEYAVLPHLTVPNTLQMEYNWLTFNGKVAPAVTPIIVRLGDRVRIRLINLGMDHHPIHLHGNTFWITGHEGARQPEPLWVRRNTVLVGVAQAQDIEFDAKYPGAWMLHCHLPHHMMNQMASNVGKMTRTPGKGMEMEGMKMGAGPTMATNANDVPGFPQDAYMESPAMAMDAMVEKPENFGLPPGWSGFMGGMMTLIRVLPPQQYEHYLSLKQSKGGSNGL